MEKLHKEFVGIWGARFYNQTTKEAHQADRFYYEKNSIFGNVIFRLEQNKEDSKDVVSQMDQARKNLAQSYQNCESFAPDAFAGNVITASADDSDISGVKSPTELHPQKDADLGPDAARKYNEEHPVVNPSETPGSLVETPEGENPDKSSPYEKDGDKDWRASAEPPPPPKAKEEGWISKNKGLLLTLGAGAAAVGGILWYKNSQDKKAGDDASVLEMEARALASSQSGSGSSSDTGSSSGSTGTDSTVGGTPANISTPQGSKLILSGAPSGASVNAILSEITVSILNPDGILTQDSHTDITVSCAEPAGCSLTGTLTVNTDAGKSKFNDLRFTNADQNVKLQFSAPGFEPVAAGTFNVTGGESPRE
jgi:hypothetical protein